MVGNRPVNWTTQGDQQTLKFSLKFEERVGVGGSYRKGRWGRQKGRSGTSKWNERGRWAWPVPWLVVCSGRCW